jgi:hypothetical protein
MIAKAIAVASSAGVLQRSLQKKQRGDHRRAVVD